VLNGSTSNELAHDVLWRRLTYSLTPQWDFYVSLRKRFYGHRVLEVGFGTGAGVLQYCHDAIQVNAIEVDPGAVAFAARMFPTPNVIWMQGDITDFNIGMYHSIVMIETLEHILDYQTALKNIYSMLHPGGQLIMSARNKNTDLRRAKELHIREWTAEQLYDELDAVFDEVYLKDYTLTSSLDIDTRITPVFAVAKKKA